jgi:hypothetical protein
MYRCDACDETWKVPKPPMSNDGPAPGTHVDPDDAIPSISAHAAGAEPQAAMQGAGTLPDAASDKGRGRNGGG